MNRQCCFGKYESKVGISMKKYISGLLILVLFLSLCGCGGKKGAEGFSAGSGTPEDPYLLATAEDLFRMARLCDSKETRDDYAGAHYRLTKNIDLENKAWKPISGCGLGFEGTLEGDFYTVSGLKISSGLGDESRYYGLFAILKGTVRNLTVTGSTLKATGDNSPTLGTFAGQLLGGTLENCHTTASVKVSCSYEAGGICGIADENSTLLNCANAASVEGTGMVSSVGGIGVHLSCQVEGCSNTGPITSESDGAGIGVSLSGGASGCSNAGSVTAKKSAGGICVSFDDGALSSARNNPEVALQRCSNSGHIVSKEEMAAGIAVGCRTGTIRDCKNSGSIAGVQDVGGIFAYFQPSSFGTACKEFKVLDCYNSGNILGGTEHTSFGVGGIGGDLYESDVRFLFENCENAGPVSSGSPAGGIVGRAHVNHIQFTGCRNTGSLQGVRFVGGIAGRAVPALGTLEIIFRAQDCRNTGSLYTQKPEAYQMESYCGGILGHSDKDALTGQGFSEVTIEGCENSGSLEGSENDIILHRHDLCGTWA